MIEIDGNSLNLEFLRRVVFEDEKVKLKETQKEFIKKSRALVEKIASGDKPVYGINTGFGYLAAKKIPKEKVEQLQYNLIRSHTTAVGKPSPREVVRAMILLRANVLAKGYSGVRVELIEKVIEILNKKIHPVIPEQGSVGASGDLAPLAHLALALIGEGDVEYEGKVQRAEDVFKKLGIEPADLKAKEGLSLINGTQYMSSVAAVILLKAKELFKAADLALALTFDALMGKLSPFDEKIYEVRKHPEVDKVMKNIRELIIPSPFLNSKNRIDKVQDAYSVRCSPQVHGAVRLAGKRLEETLLIEMNSATDNPLVFPDEEEVLSNGNFHGEPMALTIDHFSNALVELGNISERRIERLVNPSLNHNLPAFLVKESGLNSGFMIAHVVAAALSAENMSLAHPPSSINIPTSAGQEDHVSMGANSANRLKRIFENTKRIIAIELIASAQAMELRGEKTSPPLEKMIKLLREDVSFIKEDHRLDQFIEKVAEKLDNNHYLNNLPIKLY